jgi:hypothetical protein
MVHCIVRMFGRGKGENRGTLDLVRCKVQHRDGKAYLKSM